MDRNLIVNSLRDGEIDVLISALQATVSYAQNWDESFEIIGWRYGLNFFMLPQHVSNIMKNFGYEWMISSGFILYSKSSKYTPKVWLHFFQNRYSYFKNVNSKTYNKKCVLQKGLFWSCIPLFGCSHKSSERRLLSVQRILYVTLQHCANYVTMYAPFTCTIFYSIILQTTLVKFPHVNPIWQAPCKFYLPWLLIA